MIDQFWHQAWLLMEQMQYWLLFRLRQFRLSWLYRQIWSHPNLDLLCRWLHRCQNWLHPNLDLDSVCWFWWMNISQQRPVARAVLFMIPENRKCTNVPFVIKPWDEMWMQRRTFWWREWFAASNIYRSHPYAFIYGNRTVSNCTSI